MTAAELLSLGNATHSGLVPHSGNILSLLLALGLFGCSDWLLGQEGSSAATEGTASEIVVDVDADSGAGIPVGDSA
jgi:hypothetical protein